ADNPGGSRRGARVQTAATGTTHCAGPERGRMERYRSQRQGSSRAVTKPDKNIIQGSRAAGRNRIAGLRGPAAVLAARAAYGCHRTIAGAPPKIGVKCRQHYGESGELPLVGESLGSGRGGLVGDELPGILLRQ